MTALADELTNDPLTRGYAGMTDEAAAADLNTAYREGVGSMAAVRKYMALETSRTNSGTDTTAISIMARLHKAAALTPSGATQTDPWGATANVSDPEIAACVALRELIKDDLFELAFSDARFDALLEGAKDGNVMKAADVTAIKALTVNTLTRGQELGLGVVKAGHVQAARAE